MLSSRNGNGSVPAIRLQSGSPGSYSATDAGWRKASLSFAAADGIGIPEPANRHSSLFTHEWRMQNGDAWTAMAASKEASATLGCAKSADSGIQNSFPLSFKDPGEFGR